MKKMLFILTLILGNKTYAYRLKEIAEKVLFRHKIEPHFLFFDVSDYSKYQHPINKFSNIFLTSFTAYNKHSKNIYQLNPDILFFNSWEMLPAFSRVISKIPTIIGLDTTSICNMELDLINENDYLKIGWKILRTRLVNIIYQPITNSIDYFLPMSHWVGNSLKNNYSVAPNKIKVTPPPIDVNWWVPPFKRNNAIPRLLFVANDFKRKGGDFILDLYQKKLRGCCDLTIVSNDKNISKVCIPVDVEIIQGLTQDRPHDLLHIYQRSDIFIFPTRRDWSPLVSIEAATTGLPIIATSVGAVSEIIIDGETGYLMPYCAGFDEWTEKIMILINNHDKRTMMGKNARELASSKFSYDAFATNFSDAVAHLVYKKK